MDLNHIESAESLEAAAETIVAKMAICEFYANVYAETGIALSSDQMTCRLQQSLDSALPEFYAAVLVFSAKARQYFDPSNSGNYLSHRSLQKSVLTSAKYSVVAKIGNMLKPFANEF